MGIWLKIVLAVYALVVLAGTGILLYVPSGILGAVIIIALWACLIYKPWRRFLTHRWLRLIYFGMCLMTPFICFLGLASLGLGNCDFPRDEHDPTLLGVHICDNHRFFLFMAGLAFFWMPVLLATLWYPLYLYQNRKQSS